MDRSSILANNKPLAMRIVLFMILFCGSAATVRAQTWLDAAFGLDGMTQIPFLPPVQDFGDEVVLQPDGKILVAGMLSASSTNPILLARFEEDGSMDYTFGIQGVATADPGGQSSATDLALQADGSIVVVGNHHLDAFVTRFLPNGELDTSFGDEGFVSIANVGADYLEGVVIQNDGRIVVAGTTDNEGQTLFMVARLNPDGSFDENFGNGGRVLHSFGTNVCQAFDLALMSDGRLVAVGRMVSSSDSQWDVAVARYLPSGALDPSFDDDGLVSIAWSPYEDYGYAVKAMEDGTVLVAGTDGVGSGQTHITISRLLINGAMDTTFGIGGTTRTYEGVGSETRSRGIAVDGSGRILMVGTVGPDGASSSYLCRLLPDGVLDATFGTEGELIHLAPTSNWESTTGIALQPDGKIVLAGTAYLSGTYALIALRYLAEPLVGITEGEPLVHLLRVDGTRIEFTLPYTGPVSYQLADVAGRVIQVGSVPSQEDNVRRVGLTSKLGNGVYVLSVMNHTERSTVSFVIDQ